MKNLITLILSAALLCPMWAGAQAVVQPQREVMPQSIGPMKWQFLLPVNINVNAMKSATSTIQINSISYLYLSYLLPRNESAIFAINGYVQQDSNGPIVPVSGTAVGVDSNGAAMMNYQANYLTPATGYIMSITLGSNLITCAVSSSTLNGSCQSWTPEAANSSSSRTPPTSLIYQGYLNDIAPY